MADLELACRVVFGQQSETFDPAPIAYRDVKISDKLRFGYYVNGMYLPLHLFPIFYRCAQQSADGLRSDRWLRKELASSPKSSP